MRYQDDLAPLADAAAFIFTGSIARAGVATMPTVPVNATVVVSVDDVVKAPPGFGSFAGREVTVQLVEPLAAGRYLFFADPLAVGGGLAVRERAHLDAVDAMATAFAADAVERGYAARIGPRMQAAALVVLGKIGEVKPIRVVDERDEGVPWAMAPLSIDHVFRGKPAHSAVTLVGPGRASRLLPRTPALRSGLQAILVLTTPPAAAIEVLPEGERQRALFIADTADIQPPARRRTIEHIAAGLK
ncbi:MAG TPA: hypothetical protein VKI44_28525 [Acetobacteraceae bacterium]|nr:hypothetical protein [Acetobacteraceae bacterium]